MSEQIYTTTLDKLVTNCNLIINLILILCIVSQDVTSETRGDNDDGAPLLAMRILRSYLCKRETLTKEVIVMIVIIDLYRSNNQF